MSLFWQASSSGAHEGDEGANGKRPGSLRGNARDTDMQARIYRSFNELHMVVYCCTVC